MVLTSNFYEYLNVGFTSITILVFTYSFYKTKNNDTPVNLNKLFYLIWVLKTLFTVFF